LVNQSVMGKRLEIVVSRKTLFDRFVTHNRIFQIIWKKLRSALRAEQTTLAQARAGLASPHILKLLHSMKCSEGRVMRARERAMLALDGSSTTSTLIRRKNEEIISLRSQLRAYQLAKPDEPEVNVLRKEVKLLTLNAVRLNSELKYNLKPENSGVYLFKGDLPAHLQHVEDRERAFRHLSVLYEARGDAYSNELRAHMATRKELAEAKRQSVEQVSRVAAVRDDPESMTLRGLGTCPVPAHQAALGILAALDDLKSDKEFVESEMKRPDVRPAFGYKVETIALRYIDGVDAARSIAGLLEARKPAAKPQAGRAPPTSRGRGQRGKRR